MKQIGEYKLQFESFDELKYFIKDNIQYYGDQYCMSDIDTDEYLTNEYIEDDFLNYEDRIKDLTTFWTGVCFAKQFYIPLTNEFYPHIAFYVGIRFEFFKYSDGTMSVDLFTDNDYINQQTEYQFFDKNGEEYDMDVIINIIEESDKFRKEDERMIGFIKRYYDDETCENVQDKIKELKEKYKGTKYCKNSK